jgi:hypothetical protein
VPSRRLLPATSYSLTNLWSVWMCRRDVATARPVICVSAYFLLGERMKKMQVLGVAMSMAGVVVVVHPPMIFGGEWDVPWLGVMFLLAAATSVTATILLIRVVADVESTIIMTLWCDPNHLNLGSSDLT